MRDTNNRFIRLPQDQVAILDKVSKADCLFLKEKGLMDYSLLLVIESIYIPDIDIENLSPSDMISQRDSINKHNFER